MIPAIVLAAGESSRMGSPKAILRLQGGTFISVICRRLADASPGGLVVVLGAHAGEVIEAGLPAGVRVAFNEAWAEGQISSLRCGIRALSPGAAGALVALVDHPLVEASTYAGMMAAAGACPGMILVAEYRGMGGHPVVFPAAVFDEILSAPAGEGARWVVRRDPSRVRRIPFDDPGIAADIDTPEEYMKALAGRGADAGGKDGRGGRRFRG